ncbi:MAG: alpha/beta hydrolase [Leptolyngbya sp.]|nr:alpha/beta hydrolase [Leptolyngbya sp.]
MSLHVHLRGSGAPILCLHGHPGSGAAMDVFTAHLSQRFCTLAPDLRGYGRSPAGSPFAMADHLADLTALLDQQGLDRTLILGWSLGGILALELALHQPQRVAGLILIATAARPRGNHPPITWQDNLHTAIASLVNRAIPGWRWNIDTFGRRSLYRHLLQRHTAAAYRRLAYEGLPAYLRTSRAASQALNRALRQGYNRLADLPRIQVPVLVLCAEGDRHITAAASQETAAHLPHSTLHCYPQAAHLFPWELPDQMLADIDRWLTAHGFPPP